MGNLPSEKMRGISAESDCLHLGMGWTREDLSKPHVMVQSSAGESHPGSSHLGNLAGAARDGLMESGMRPAEFTVTDMCDGVAQGSPAMGLSLPSREFIAYMIEIQARSTLCDAIVFIASCDKSLPAHLISAARLNLPSLVMPGGVMSAGAGLLSCDAMFERRRDLNCGKSTENEFFSVSSNTCPTAGACQQFGTAGTMQAMAEALGLALPGHAHIPTANAEIIRACRKSGAQIRLLLEKGIRPRDILTKEAFYNAITVHAAIGGSANAVMHLIAIANNAGVELGVSDFDRINRNAPYLTDVLCAGKYPTEYFWYAGGVRAVMAEIRDLLEPGVMTATGRTLGENLDEWASSGGARETSGYLANCGLTPRDLIRPRSNPRGVDGGLAVLKGNIAPEGALIKHSAVHKDMMRHRGRCAVFYDEDEAIKALDSGGVRAGDVIAVLGMGPNSCGMPEMFRVGDAVARNPALSSTTCVLTDGRYSGCTVGPAIGYVSPEGLGDGPVGKLRTGDVIEIDIPKRQINLVEGIGNNGRIANGDALIASRPPLAYETLGKEAFESAALDLYRRRALPALRGGGIER